MVTHVTLLGRVGREGVGSGQVGDLETVAAVGAVADLGPDGHAAVIAHMLVAARYGVEKRGLAAVGVAHQRDGDGAGVARHDLGDARAARLVGFRRAELLRPDFRGRSLRRGASALPGVCVVLMAVALAPREVLPGFVVGEHDDHIGLAAPQRDVVAHDFILDRVLQGGVQNHFDPLSADKTHLHDAAAKASVAHHFDNRRRFAGLQFG